MSICSTRIGWLRLAKTIEKFLPRLFSGKFFSAFMGNVATVRGRLQLPILVLPGEILDRREITTGSIQALLQRHFDAVIIDPNIVGKIAGAVNSI